MKADGHKHGLQGTGDTRQPRGSVSMATVAGLVVASAAVLWTACTPAGSLGGSQTFSVEYRVDGTFDECTVFYITRKDNVGPQDVNEGGQVIDEDVTLPWSLSFDVTVTPMFPFNTQIGAVCASADAADVESQVLVDGAVVDSDQQSGRNVNAQADFTLTVP